MADIKDLLREAMEALGKKDRDLAISKLKAILMIDPHNDRVNSLLTKIEGELNIRTYYEKAQRLLMEGDKKQAIEELQKILEIDPDNIKVKRLLNKFKREIVFDRYIKNAEKALKDNEVGKAITHFESALRYNPQNKDINQRLAMLKSEIGEDYKPAAVSEEEEHDMGLTDLPSPDEIVSAIEKTFSYGAAQRSIEQIEEERKRKEREILPVEQVKTAKKATTAEKDALLSAFTEIMKEEDGLQLASKLDELRKTREKPVEQKEAEIEEIEVLDEIHIIEPSKEILKPKAEVTEVPRPVEAKKVEEAKPKPVEAKKVEEAKPKPIEAKKVEEAKPKPVEAKKVEEAKPKPVEAKKVEEAKPKPIEAKKVEEAKPKPVEAKKVEEAKPKPVEAKKVEEAKPKPVEAKKVEEAKPKEKEKPVEAPKKEKAILKVEETKALTPLAAEKKGFPIVAVGGIGLFVVLILILVSVYVIIPIIKGRKTEVTKVEEKKAEENVVPETKEEVPAGKGTIKIAKCKKGAEIFINGEDKGKYPDISYFDLASGEYNLSAKLGDLTWEDVVVVKPNETKDIEIEFVSGKGTLSLSSTPIASVYSNGQRIGSTPLSNEFSAGKHVYTLRADGYEEASVTVDIKDGKEIKKSVTLKSSGKVIAKKTEDTTVPTKKADIKVEPKKPDEKKDIVKKGKLVPAELISSAKASYPASASKVKFSGSTSIVMTIGTDGRVTDVRVSKSSGNDACDKEAVSAARKYRFKPAMRGDAPIESPYSISIDFKGE